MLARAVRHRAPVPTLRAAAAPRRLLSAPAPRLHSWEDGPSRASARRLGLLPEVLFYRPHQLLLGVAIGGLGATLGGLVYFQHLDNEQKARVEALVAQVQAHVQGHVERLDPSKPHGGLPVPWPVVTTVGWTIVLGITSAFAWNRARMRMQYRLMERVVNFSLNYVHDGKLVMRTLHECELDSVLIANPAATRMVAACATRTRRDFPFVHLPENEVWFVLNAFGNFLSSQFAHGFVAHERGLPTARAWYHMALTFELDAEKGRKIRVVIASDELLRAMENMPQPGFEEPTHVNRWHLLKTMSNRLLFPERCKAPILHRVELAVPVAPPS